MRIAYSIILAAIWLAMAVLLAKAEYCSTVCTTIGGQTFCETTCH